MAYTNKAKGLRKFERIKIGCEKESGCIQNRTFHKKEALLDFSSLWRISGLAERGKTIRLKDW